VQIPDVLGKATHVLNRLWVAQMAEDALGALRAEFFAEAGHARLEQLQGVVRGGTHVDVLAVFFLMLNIVPSMKARVLAVDPGNTRKIGRFLLDLRRELVVAFFCSGQTAAEFVAACSEAWCIA